MKSSVGADRGPSRRELLAFPWFPFFRPKHIDVGSGRFRIHRHGRSNRRYVVIHGNEESAREVLLHHIQVHQGIAYIVEGHTRNIEVGGLRIDPNRMFSRAGAEASLKRLNPNLDSNRTPDVLNHLDHERKKLIQALTPPRGGLTFALHNNSEAYSVADEVPISDQTSLAEPRNPHAFFLCTDPRDFEILKKSPYNVVLQQHPSTADDGSLSRLSAVRGFRYVNLEVALGQPDRQKEMVWWLEWNLP
jgi:hypothetical protein